jgi:hypothetical protein
VVHSAKVGLAVHVVQAVLVVHSFSQGGFSCSCSSGCFSGTFSQGGFSCSCSSGC